MTAQKETPLKESVAMVKKIMMDGYRVIRQRRPLKIGIHKDVMALPELEGLSNRAKRVWLHMHTGQDKYKANVEKSNVRFDLNGNESTEPKA